MSLSIKGSVLETDKPFCVLGKKLPEYPNQAEEVLLLNDRVTEAKRLAKNVIVFILMLSLSLFSINEL